MNLKFHRNNPIFTFGFLVFTYIQFLNQTVLTMKQSILTIFIFATIIFGISSCTPQRQGDEGETDTTAMDDEEMGAMEEETMEEPTAVAQLEAKSGSNASGTVTFTEMEDGVHLMVDLQGLTPGTHAIHLHENGDCSAPDASSAGGHWNPSSEEHGHINETDEFHFGDIGNLEVGSDSTATYETTIDIWNIGGEADANIVGKAVVVHAGADDFTSQPSGAAGSRVACGVVEMQ